MMMIYLQRNRQQSRRNRGLWSALLIAFLIIAGIILLQIFAHGAIDKIALSTGGPVAKIYTSIKNNVAFAAAMVKSRHSLVDDNEELKAKLADIEAEHIRFNSILKENQDLLSAYGRSPFTKSVVIANVTAKPPQSPYDLVIVDIGSRDGVALGNRAYALGGIPIGKVVETSDATSKVVLYSSIGEENQFVHERTGASISAVGTGGGNLEATVAQEVDIVEGDKLTLPQFGGTVVATVVQVESTVTSASKRVLFRLPINLFNLRWVEIVRAE